VTRAFTAKELSEETGVSLDRLDWLTLIRILKPRNRSVSPTWHLASPPRRDPGR